MCAGGGEYSILFAFKLLAWSFDHRLRIPTFQGRSTLGGHRPGIHRLQDRARRREVFGGYRLVVVLEKINLNQGCFVV